MKTTGDHSFKAVTQRVHTTRFESILDAAAAVFRERGYHHSTIADIAREVGLQKGSLYHHIKGKEQLLYEIVIYSLNVYVDSLKRILTSRKPPGEVVKDAILAHMLPIEYQFDRIYVFINQFNELSEEYRIDVQRKLEDYERLWISVLEKGKRQGVFRSDLDSKMTMLAIFGMCNWTMRWYKPGKRLGMEELAGMYARQILEGINA
jgi:AcrR family transcriptional regulator